MGAVSYAGRCDGPKRKDNAVGLMSKMFGADKFQRGLDKVFAEVAEQIDAGRTEFIITVYEVDFPGRFDVALDHVLHELQEEGVIAVGVDMQGWSGFARVRLRVAAPVPQATPVPAASQSPTGAAPF